MSWGRHDPADGLALACDLPRIGFLDELEDVFVAFESGFEVSLPVPCSEGCDAWG